VTEDTNNLLANSAPEDTTNIADDNVPLAAGDQEADNSQMDSMNQMTGIDDQQTPLAAMNNCVNCQCIHQCDRHYWWWVLALIAAITGKVAWDQKNLYDEEKEEKEKERKARNRDQERYNYRDYNRDDDPADFS
jgi:hypothetical protein